jgi:hypothetical protein
MGPKRVERIEQSVSGLHIERVRFARHPRSPSSTRAAPRRRMVRVPVR